MIPRSWCLVLSGCIHIVAGTICAATAWLLKGWSYRSWLFKENLPLDLNAGPNKDKLLMKQRKFVGFCGSILVAMAVVQLIMGLAQIAMASMGNFPTLKTVWSRVAGCICLGLVMILQLSTTIFVCQLDGSLLIWEDKLIHVETEINFLAPIIAVLLHTTLIIQICLLKFSMNEPVLREDELSFFPNLRLTPMLKSTPNHDASLFSERLVKHNFTYATIEKSSFRRRFISDKSSRPRILSCFVDSADYEKQAGKSRAKFPLTNQLRCTMKTLRGKKSANEVKSPQVVIHRPSVRNVSQTSHQKIMEKQTEIEDDVFGDKDFEETDKQTKCDKSGIFGRNSVHVSMTIDFENRFDFPSLGKFNEAFLLFLNSSDEPQLSPSAFSVDISSFSVFSDSLKDVQ